MATGEAIVKKALDQLKSSLTTEDVRTFSNTSLADLWREARKIEKEQADRRDLQSMRRIEPLLRTLESYAGVIEVLCQGYSPMAFVWGPVKLMLLLASNYRNVMEKILQAFSDISDALPRLDRLKATFSEDNNFNQVVGLIYSDIIEFHRRAYKLFRRKAWHFWFASDWRLFEHRFKLILQKLTLHCDLLDKEAGAAHLSEMKQDRDKRQLEEDAFERQRQHQMAQDIFRWLSAAEDQQEEHLHRISDSRQPETCDWILKDPRMRPWIEDDRGDAILWMNGIPGAGKSFLCSLIIENLQSQQRLSTLYYFFRSWNETTCAVMLRTLAIQLLQQNMDMAPLVHQAYLQEGSNKSSPAMKNLLIKLLTSSKVTRIVVDGMDEISHATQQELIKNLIEIQKSVDPSCKLLVSSRDEPQIQKSLGTKNCLNLGGKTVESIDLFIKERMKGLQELCPGIDAGLVKLAEKQLQDKARGMFLYVRLVTDMLKDQMSEFDFENAINQLPEGFDEAYGRILTRIESLRPAQLRQRAFSILYWVCAARRPIAIHEVADGIVLHPGQTILNRRNRSTNTNRDIVELCAPLLQGFTNGVVDLVHFSAKEYLLHKSSGPFIDIAQAHRSIAISCVINLTSCLDFVPGKANVLSEGELESRVVQGYYGLQSYSHEFWAEHVLAYLERVEDPDGVSRELIDTLEAFSAVWKYRHTGTLFSSPVRAVEAPLSLNHLRNYPALHGLITSWLHFKSELHKTRPTFETLDSQEQWRLRKDETFLSLIDSRLSTLVERLLNIKSSQLPSHIDEDDFKHFVGRYHFLCRYQGCNYRCHTIQERNTHEESHVLSFPCLQCDFSGRGFRTHKDLEKHTQKCHMSPEDYKAFTASASGRESPTFYSQKSFVDSGYASDRAYSTSNSSIKLEQAARLGEKMRSRVTADDEIQSIASEQDDTESQESTGRLPQAAIAVGLLANLLEENNELSPLCKEALSLMEVRRFVNNFQRLLRQCYLDLQQNAKGNLEVATCRLLKGQKSRKKIAERIAGLHQPETDETSENRKRQADEDRSRASYMERWIADNQGLRHTALSANTPGPVPDDTLQDQEENSSEEDASEDGNEATSLPHKSEMKSFITGGDAFQNLVTNFRIFLMPTSLRSLARIIMSVPTDRIHFVESDDLSFSNKIKIFIESITEDNWNWWPLRAKMKILQKDQTRLLWQCHCNTQLWSEVSKLHAAKLKTMLECRRNLTKTNHLCGLQTRKKCWTWNTVLYGIIQLAGSISGQHSSGSSARKAQADGLQTTSVPQAGQTSDIAMTPMPPGTQTSPQDSTQTGIPMPHRSFVLFGVAGKRRTPDLAQIDTIKNPDDLKFFSTMLQEYRKHWGSLRYWFSLWRLNHCDFVKFEKIKRNRLLVRKNDLPEDAEYEYDPRPPNAENPPIDPHEFTMAFTSSCRNNCWLSPFHDCIEAASGTYAVTRIPKRRSMLEMETPETKFAWGLQAQHVISLVHVLLYHLLILVGTFGFWAWWNVRHPNDLQNAAVPMTVVTTLLSLFWTYLHWHLEETSRAGAKYF